MVIGIVGLGLIGGSLAKTIKKNTGHTVFGTDINESEIFAAEMHNAIDGKLDGENLMKCNLILLCAYPKAVVDFVTQNAEKFMPGAVVTDCCGVKRKICKKLIEKSNKNNFVFIGGHPMAGTQFSGFKSSGEKLFKDATMILTPDKDISIPMREFARDFFLSLGFKKVHFTTAEEHDEKIAFTSQLPHIISNAYIKSPTSSDCTDLAAGSYRDLIRVAKLNAPMWAELFLENGDFLGRELDILIDNLEKYSSAIKNKNKKELIELLK